MRIFSLILVMIFSLSANSKLSDGMAKTLPANHVEKGSYLYFENFRTRPRAPIAGRVVINGKRARTMDDLFQVFSEDVAASLPKDQKIKESINSEGQTVWRYPIGTKVIHQLDFKDDKKSIFELRMMERVNDKRWAFGIYILNGNKFELQDYEGHKDEEYHLKQNGDDLHIKLHHIPLHVCQKCHSRTTSAPHQYKDLMDVGPCEFTPTNPFVKKDWVENFKREFGYDPIEALSESSATR